MIYGTSYGTYLAAGVGVRHPDRVHAMVLDSPVLSAQDIDAVRDDTRRVLWDGDDPEAAELAPKVRKLVDDGVLTPAAGQLTAAVYGFAGPAVLTRQLDLLLRVDEDCGPCSIRRRGFCSSAKRRIAMSQTWSAGSGSANSTTVRLPDGSPLDPAVAFREFAAQPLEFEAEPYDLEAEMPKFTWPTVVVSGGRDLITPRAVADEIVSLIPDSVLAELGDRRPQRDRLPASGPHSTSSRRCTTATSAACLAARRSWTRCRPAWASGCWSVRSAPPPSSNPRCPLLFRVWCSGLLHEADLGVVQIADARRAEVRQATAHRDVARPTGTAAG